MNEYIKGTLALVCHGMASIDSNSFSPDQIIATKSVVLLEDLKIDVLLMIETSTIGGFVIENMCYICFYVEILFSTQAITINNILGPV